MNDDLVIRPATPADVDTIYAFIKDLAAYEREPDGVTGTVEMLGDALFGDALFGASPAAEALLAEQEGEPVGFALFHGTFSTWECTPGMWLEDLYVSDRARGGGVGYRLMTTLAAIAVQRGCSRLEWVALDWNEPALSFYARLGAERLSDWEMHRLQDESLGRVAAAAAPASPA